MRWKRLTRTCTSKKCGARTPSCRVETLLDASAIARSTSDERRVLPNVETKLKPGITIETLNQKAAAMSDTEFAKKMGAAKIRMLRTCMIETWQLAAKMYQGTSVTNLR